MSDDDFNSLTPEQVESIEETLRKWSDPLYEENVLLEYDWRKGVREKFRDGDIEGMRKVALPAVQYSVIELAHAAKNESTRLEASRLLLSQEGQGPVQKIEASMNFQQMPTDQLMSFISSKIGSVAKLAGIDPKMLLPGVVEGEVVKEGEVEEIFEEEVMG